MTEVLEGPYEVILLWDVKQQLRATVAKASSRQQKEGFLAVIGAILARLARDPIAGADPLRHYENAGLVEMQFLQDKVYACYGVDETNKIVYVKRLRPVLSHPLAEP